MPDHRATRAVRYLRPLPSITEEANLFAEPVPAPPRTALRPVKLTPTQRYEVECARELVDLLEDLDAAELTVPQLAYTIGRLHGAASGLLDVIDAITEL